MAQATPSTYQHPSTAKGNTQRHGNVGEEDPPGQQQRRARHHAGPIFISSGSTVCCRDPAPTVNPRFNKAEHHPGGPMATPPLRRTVPRKGLLQTRRALHQPEIDQGDWPPNRQDRRQDDLFLARVVRTLTARTAAQARLVRQSPSLAVAQRIVGCIGCVSARPLLLHAVVMKHGGRVQRGTMRMDIPSGTVCCLPCRVGTMLIGRLARAFSLFILLFSGPRRPSCHTAFHRLKSSSLVQELDAWYTTNRQPSHSTRTLRLSIRQTDYLRTLIGTNQHGLDVEKQDAAGLQPALINVQLGYRSRRQ